MSHLPFLKRYPNVTLFAGALLCVFGSQLTVLDHYGTDLPFQDDWGKVADFVLAPLLEGNPAWLPAALLPHNEHRIYFTIGSEVLLTLVSGQWDARQQCVLSALLHAVIAACLALFAYRRLPRPLSSVAAGLVIALAAVPLAWDNVVWGFQSQFYFLIGFSLLGMDGLLREKFSAPWFLGLLAMVCALVAMGSGFLCAGVVLPLLLRDTLADRRAWFTNWASLIAAAAVFLLGWHFRFEPPWHAGLRAENGTDFLTYAVHCLAWPLPKFALLGALFYSPLLVLGARWLLRGAPPGEAGHTMKFILAAGGWALLHIAALAYARGQGGGFPANRYGDVFLVGLVANAYALCVLAGKSERTGWVVWAAAWLAVLVCASGLSLGRIFGEELPRHRRESRAFEASVRDYIRDGDAAALRRRPIPFSDYDWFQRLLDRPSIRAVLPPSVSNPRHVSALSHAARHLSKWCWAFIALGVVGVLFAVSGRHHRPVNP